MYIFSVDIQQRSFEKIYRLQNRGRGKRHGQKQRTGEKEECDRGKTEKEGKRGEENGVIRQMERREKK